MCLLCVSVISASAWATDFTLSSASSVTKDGITVSFAQGEGSESPAWYTAGLRLYAKNTVTISSTKTITGITFNWEKQGKKEFASVTASGGTYSHPSNTGDGTWTGSATSVTFTLGNAGQLQLNTLAVTVSDGGDPTPDPTPTPSKSIFYESFNTNNGTGGNDGSWNGSIASSDFHSDNIWSVENAYGANKCAKFGGSSAKGIATTPELGIVGDAILTFKAAAWNTSGEGTTLNLSASTGVTLDQSSVSMKKGEWTEYEVKVTGLTATSKITFTAKNKSNNRFFLDEVKVQGIYTRTVTSGNWGTLCLPYAATVEGATLYSITDKDASSITVTEAGTTAAAGVPYIFKATATQLVATYTGTTYTDAGTANGLHGTYSDIDFADVAGYSDGDYYVVLPNKVQAASSKSGVDAYRAYIVLGEITSAPGVKGIRLGFDEATAITELTESTEKTEGTEGIYNLNGQQLSAPQRGINIIGGKKVLVK